MTRKRQTWEAVNPDGDYIIVRYKKDALEAIEEVCEVEDPYNYFVRKGKPMTDEELKALPELEGWG